MGPVRALRPETRELAIALNVARQPFMRPAYADETTGFLLHRTIASTLRGMTASVIMCSKIQETTPSAAFA